MSAYAFSVVSASHSGGLVGILSRLVSHSPAIGHEYEYIITGSRPWYAFDDLYRGCRESYRGDSKDERGDSECEP